jgi:hypothetical protein
MVERYCILLEQALEQRAFKVDHKISEGLRFIAEHLGFLKAGPRAIVELHRTSLKKMISNVPPQKAQAYMEEGRLMVLELMGDLVTYYRNYYIGAKGSNFLESKSRVDKEKGS